MRSDYFQDLWNLRMTFREKKSSKKSSQTECKKVCARDRPTCSVDRPLRVLMQSNGNICHKTISNCRQNRRLQTPTRIIDVVCTWITASPSKNELALFGFVQSADYPSGTLVATWSVETLRQVRCWRRLFIADGTFQCLVFCFVFCCCSYSLQEEMLTQRDG